jgi:hypothetical protein
VPIRQIYEHWVAFEELWASQLLFIKEDAEANAAEAHDTQTAKKRPPKKG